MNITLRLTTQSLIRALRVALLAKSDVATSKTGEPGDGKQ